MTISRRDRRFAIAILFALIAALLFALRPAPTDAACTDPLSGNDPQVWRSLSGVELDWHFSVAAGCTTKVQVTVYRPDRVELDPRWAIHAQSPALLLAGPVEGTQNVVITTGRVVEAVLTADGRIYGFATIDPAAVP